MNNKLLIKNATIATFNKENSILTNSDILITNGIISAIGKNKNHANATQVIDAKEQLITPGLIDCHTHIIYAGNRSNEFAMRLNGATYTEIAQSGGGILATVKATREASLLDLQKLGLNRAKNMLQQGVTTIEIKSGYGLDLDTEIKILKAAKYLAKALPINIITTFLGAHTTPPEYASQKDNYIDFIIENILPIIAKENLANFVDGFCETIAFNTRQIEKLFIAAKKFNLAIKLHAEQLSNQQGALLAARFAASSVDHLEYLDENDCKLLNNNKTVAVLLPGAYYFLKEKQLPPIRALREENIPIAIASDANPGSSPFFSLPLIMNMACVCFGLSIEEAWTGVTKNAARALDLDSQLGSIEVGKKADIVVWSTDNLNDIVYNPTTNYCNHIIKAGKIIKLNEYRTPN